jgi:hypothetical protein
MKYDVHIYATVRVKVCGVEANSQAEAMKKAEEQTDLYETIGNCPGTDYAEEITGFLVDEAGDTEYHKTRYYNQDGKPEPMSSARTAGEKRTV